MILESNDHIMSWKEAMDLQLILPIEPFNQDLVKLQVT